MSESQEELKRFNVRVDFTLGGDIHVDAKDADDAADKVREMWRDNDININEVIDYDCWGSDDDMTIVQVDELDYDDKVIEESKKKHAQEQDFGYEITIRHGDRAAIVSHDMYGGEGTEDCWRVDLYHVDTEGKPEDCPYDGETNFQTMQDAIDSAISHM